MSFYDDAKFMFLAGGAAGKDGKAYNIKPISPAKDFTFSRGTNLTATRVGKDGYIEKGRENLFLQSNNFDTTWSLGGSPTLTSGHTGYDGSQDAWKLVTAKGANIYQTVSPSGVNTFSFYVRGDGSTGVRMYLDGPGGAADVFFNLATGSVQQTSPAVIDETIEAITGSSGDTDRWYRISLTFYDDDTSSGDNQNVTRCRLYTTANGTSNEAGTLFIQDAQLERGLVATDYIETGTTTAKAGLLEDEPRFDYTGGGCPALLIEGNATNLIEHTEYFGDWSEDGTATVTLNQTTSPEGLNNAALLDYGASPAGPDRISTTATITGSTAYSFSVFAKKKDASKIQLRNYHLGSDAASVFDLDAETASAGAQGVDSVQIENYGNGWYRCTMNFTSDSGDTQADLRIGAPNTYSDSGEEIYIYGAQLEANDYSTSYIPNYGAAATATRTYDDPNDLVHGITMGTSCSIFLEATNFKVTETGGAQTSFLQIMDATSPSTADRFLFLGVANTASTFTLQAQNKESGTPATDTLSKTGLTMGSPFKALARYDGTSFDLFVNGVLEGSETIVADDHFGRVGLKNLTSQTQNGHSISQVILFDSALSDTECEELTTL